MPRPDLERGQHHLVDNQRQQYGLSLRHIAAPRGWPECITGSDPGIFGPG